MGMRVVRRVSETYTPRSGLTESSLFAGIGGFTLAAKHLGMPTISWSEFDPDVSRQVNQEVMAARFPDAIALGDVTTVTYADLGSPQLITAGSPCQDFSIAGLRAGLAGARSGLFTQFVRIIREGLVAGTLKYAVWENVTGALSSHAGADFANVVAAMVGAERTVLSLPKARGRVSRWAGVARGPLGYFSWRTLDAQHFGVAQRRQRIYGVFSRDERSMTALFGEDGTLPATPDVSSDEYEVWLLDEDDHGFDTSNRPLDSVKIRLSDVIDRDVDERYYLSEKACLGVLRRAARREKTLPDALHLALWSRAGFPDEYAPTSANWGGRDIASVLVRNREGKPGGGKGPLVSEDLSLTLATGNDQILFEPMPFSLRGRDGGAQPEADPDGVMPALRGEGGSSRGYIAMGVSENERAERLTPYARSVTSGGGKPGQGYPAALTSYGVRRLTPVECERLQGFPDGWTDIGGTTDAARYRQLGNAVAVPCAAWVLGRIQAAEEDLPLPSLADIHRRLPWFAV